MSKSRRIRRCLQRVFLIVLLALAVMPGKRTSAATAAEKEVFDFFTDDCSLSPAAACGIMGNMKAESNFTPAITGLGSAYGLCQWGGARITRLKKYCSQHGYSYSSMTGQLHFIAYELETYYPKVYTYLRNVSNSSTGAYNAGYYFCLHYEVPANGSYAAAYRAKLARDTYWKSLGSVTPYLTLKGTSKGITLKWTGKGKGRALIMRSTKKDGTYTQIASLANSKKTYTDTTAKKGTRYYYYVVWGSDSSKSTHSTKAYYNLKQSLKDSEAVATLKKTSYVYTGKAKKPGVTVYYGTAKLKKGRDYTVSYTKNINAGKATVTIKGKGSYTGTVKKKFTIKKASWKCTAKNQSVKLSRKKYTPVWKVKTLTASTASSRVSLKSGDKTMAKVSGKTLILKAKGQVEITVVIKKDKNHLRTEKTFTLTIR